MKEDSTGAVSVRSFDLFDTLLGRFHYRPESVFDLVQNNFPFPGFTFFRMAAAFQSDQTLPDIYRHFQRLTGISDEECAALQKFEFETELAHVFPILENLHLVRGGDLIVSDTYYNTDQVRTILERLGLTSKVEIYASPRGKSSGRIWHELKSVHAIESHFGDSLHADVSSPLAQGISGVHFKESVLSLEEMRVAEMGQMQLAYLMRALRLSNPYAKGEAEWELWNEQAKFNVPILVQASLYLHEFCQTHGKKRILFTARDGCLWIQVFRSLFPEYDSIYFHASRFLYTAPTASYIDYVRELYTDDAVVVDVQGQGRSCTRFFTEHLAREPVYLAIVNSAQKHYAMVRKKTVWEESEGIEMINYDTCGALYDFQEGVPFRAEPEYPVKWVIPMHACIAKCIEFLPRFTFGGFDKNVLEWAVNATMDSELVLKSYLPYAKYHCHLREGGIWRHMHLVDHTMCES
jgi:ketosteroid isomerase-like protein